MQPASRFVLRFARLNALYVKRKSLFIKEKYWYVRLARTLLHYVRWNLLEYRTMTAAQQFLTAAFPEFEVLTEPRPDGGLLLTLRNDDRTLVKRALSKGQTQTRIQLEWVVSSVRRDLALEAGMSPSIAHLQSQSRTALPTYEYA